MAMQIPVAARPPTSLGEIVRSRLGLLISASSGLLPLIGFQLSSRYLDTWHYVTQDVGSMSSGITIDTIWYLFLDVLQLGMMVLAIVLAILGLFLGGRTLNWLTPLMLALAAGLTLMFSGSHLLGDVLSGWGFAGILAGGIITLLDRANDAQPRFHPGGIAQMPGAAPHPVGTADQQRVPIAIPVIGLVSVGLYIMGSILASVSGNGSHLAESFDLTASPDEPLVYLLAILSATLPLAMMALGGLAISIMAFFVRPSPVLAGVYLGIALPGFALVIRRFFDLSTFAPGPAILLLLASAGLVSAAFMLAHQVDFRRPSSTRLPGAILLVCGGALVLVDGFIPWSVLLGRSNGGSVVRWISVVDLFAGPFDPGIIALVFTDLLPQVCAVVAGVIGVVALVRPVGAKVRALALVLGSAFLLSYLTFAGPDLVALKVATMVMLLGAILLALDHPPSPGAVGPMMPMPRSVGRARLSVNQIATLIILAGALLVAVGYLIPWGADVNGNQVNGWGALFRTEGRTDLPTILDAAAFATLPIQAALIALIPGLVGALIRSSARSRVVLAACAFVAAAVELLLAPHLGGFNSGSFGFGYGYLVVQVGFLVLVTGALVLLWHAVAERTAAPTPAMGAPWPSAR